MQRTQDASQHGVLKYGEELLRCSDQPCPRTPKFRPREQPGCFRFLKKGTATDADFIPFAKTEHGQAVPGLRRCDEYALSFFDSLESIRKKWAILMEREDAESRYGTHVGMIDLTQDDGLLGPVAQQSGHLSLHEYGSAPAFAPRIRSISALPPRPKTLPGLPRAEDDGAGHGT
jgi:hypothetical protein